MELVHRMKKVRAKKMMGTMEVVVAVMVVVIGILLWLVETGGYNENNSQSRVAESNLTQASPMNIDTPSAMILFQSQKPPLISQCQR